MKDSYLRRNRLKILPEVNGDFTSDHAEIKSKSVKSMTWNEYIWFSCDHYMIHYYSGIGIPLLLCGTITTLLAINRSFWLILPLFFTFLMARELVKRIRSWPTVHKLTLYDVFFKEDDILVDPNAEEEK